MFRRKTYAFLLAWKKQKIKKALCIFGARQIGKTTLIRHFAEKNYKHFVEINFILDAGAVRIFEGKKDANTIITNLTAYTQRALVPGQTLVFFDEVQACPEARAAIKFLVEDGRFDYIESGSLLGVSYKDVPSYPVGFEELHHMFPMDFEEFMWANGVQQETITYLQECMEKKLPVSGAVHETMLKLFYTYIVVGGMPQVVDTYIKTHDIGRVVQNQQDILNLYKLDIAKYSSDTEKLKIKAIFESIPAQLNEKNRRFFLNSIDKNARQNRYQNSFLWLAYAGVALPCYNVELPQPPLKLNEKHSLFKLFMGDTGLLCAACMDNIQFSLLQGEMEINMGSILENVMAQSLHSNGFALNYFDSGKYGEVDFVIQNGLKVDLLEIKSGNSYTSHRALDKILAVQEWGFGQTLVFCRGNVDGIGSITYLPWYMIMFYRQRQVPENSTFTLDLSALKLEP